MPARPFLSLEVLGRLETSAPQSLLPTGCMEAHSGLRRSLSQLPWMTVGTQLSLPGLCPPPLLRMAGEEPVQRARSLPRASRLASGTASRTYWAGSCPPDHPSLHLWLGPTPEPGIALRVLAPAPPCRVTVP